MAYELKEALEDYWDVVVRMGSIRIVYVPVSCLHTYDIVPESMVFCRRFIMGFGQSVLGNVVHETAALGYYRLQDAF